MDRIKKDVTIRDGPGRATTQDRATIYPGDETVIDRSKPDETPSDMDINGPMWKRDRSLIFTRPERERVVLHNGAKARVEHATRLKPIPLETMLARVKAYRRGDDGIPPIPDPMLSNTPLKEDTCTSIYTSTKPSATTTLDMWEDQGAKP